MERKGTRAAWRLHGGVDGMADIIFFFHLGAGEDGWKGERKSDKVCEWRGMGEFASE